MDALEKVTTAVEPKYLTYLKACAATRNMKLSTVIRYALNGAITTGQLEKLVDDQIEVEAVKSVNAEP